MRLSIAALVAVLASCTTRPAPVVVVVDAGVVGAHAPAPAEAATPPAVATPPAGYGAELARGRQLARAKQWADAVVAFEAALAARPLDPTALTELGWAAFNAGDLDKARRVSRQVTDADVTDAGVLARALYNLGRVEEASNHAHEAIELYQQSLRVRPDRTVRGRLAGLGVHVPAPQPGPSGVLLDLENGDRACYVGLRTRDGEIGVEGDFELCKGGSRDATRLIGQPVVTETLRDHVLAASCEGDMDCGKSDEVDLIVTIRRAK
jgi:tetratricopeptide (TPR) repeat protein